jgi:hypothetical protein
MSARPSAFNSDMFVHGSRTWPVFEESYSKFNLTEKRLDSDDVACFPVSLLKKRCPALLPRPMPRPVVGCPANYGPVVQPQPDVDVRRFEQWAGLGPRFSIEGGFLDDGKAAGGTKVFWG